MHKELINVPATSRPILSVVIHTEEEFDWDRPFDRSAIGVSHMGQIHLVQDIFDAAGIVPTYVVGYPIADQEQGYEPLAKFAAAGRALIGSHLHPWVCPPHAEDICARNSYPGNLPRQLELEKLALLTDRIAASFGTRPVVYLAGRYGFGPNTGEVLEELGYEVDVSTIVPMDFSADGGPDYSFCTNHPFWFGDHRRLLAISCTGDFVGWLPPAARRFAHRLAAHPNVAWARLPGILSRIGAVERIALSPEGNTNAEMRRLTRSLVRQGFRIFVFSFHSPSVQPGFTSYVRDERELGTFLGNCREYFEFFMEELGGLAMTPLEIKILLRSLV